MKKTEKIALRRLYEVLEKNDLKKAKYMVYCLLNDVEIKKNEKKKPNEKKVRQTEKGCKEFNCLDCSELPTCRFRIFDEYKVR